MISAIRFAKVPFIRRFCVNETENIPHSTARRIVMTAYTVCCSVLSIADLTHCSPAFTQLVPRYMSELLSAWYISWHDDMTTILSSPRSLKDLSFGALHSSPPRTFPVSHSDLSKIQWVLFIFHCNGLSLAEYIFYTTWYENFDYKTGFFKSVWLC